MTNSHYRITSDGNVHVRGTMPNTNTVGWYLLGSLDSMETRIRELRTEAAQAGDEVQVKICDRALNGSARATRECVRVIAAARA